MKFIVDRVPEDPPGRGRSVPAGDRGALFSRDQMGVPTIMHPCFKRATTHAIAELFNRQTLIVVTGDAGLGKTMLLREIGRVLQAAGWHIAGETDLDAARAWHDAATRPAPGPIAVLIDGPGKITGPEMQHLLQVQSLAIVLALPNNDEARFPSCAPVRLTPMSADASAQFLSAWLRQVGISSDLLREDGVARVIELSCGVPRLLSSLLQELAAQMTLSAKPLSPLDVDAAARRLKLSVGPVPPPSITLNHPDAEQNAEPGFAGTQAWRPLVLEPDPAEAPAHSFRRLLPTNPGSAALIGLLCGVGAAIAGLLLQDVLLSSRDDPSQSREGSAINSPASPLHTMPSGASTSATPSANSPRPGKTEPN